MAEEKRTVKAIAARMDGTPASGFAPGSIQPTKDVPVLLDFNALDSRSLIGHADLTVEGDKVYATIRWARELEGRYPALGFTASAYIKGHGSQPDGRGVIIIEKYEVVALGVCVSPNQDPAIPPIKSPDGQ